jgi:transglutaminase-like putative cysteine protease
LTNNNRPYLLLPAGRSFLGLSTIIVTIDSKEYNAEKLYDSCGGYWIKFYRDSLPAHAIIEVKYKRQTGIVDFFKEPKSDFSMWINDSYYIDASNNNIKAKALELTAGFQNNIEKALQIQSYMIKNTVYNVYQNSFQDKASRTYELKYGSCINFSRLFVALCRAANIPARSVWGIVYGHDDDGIYDYHHQWAEILDNDGNWHPLDLNYSVNFNLSDIRYLDLLYSAEENPILTNSMYDIKLGEVKYFHGFPATLNGKLGFELVENNSPEYMTVRYVYRF